MVRTVPKVFLKTPKVRKLSVTSLMYFSDCRRQWWLGEKYEPNKPQMAFFAGNLVHAGLEAYYSRDKDMIDVLGAIEAFYVKELKEIKARQDGDLFTLELEELFHLAQAMLQNYAVFDGETPLEGKVVKVEDRVEIPIFTARNGNAVHLVGKIDLLLDRRGELWVVDHKTASSLYDTRGLDLDEQLTAYAYLAWKKFGKVPAGVIYNVLLKDLPAAPRLINKGKALSQDKSQKTVYALYLDAIEENEFDYGPYEDFLEHLEKVGWGKFFTRDGATRNEQELMNYERRIIQKGQDMLDILDDPDNHAYPNPTNQRCSYCSFVGACKALEDGGDYQAILDYHFQPKTYRR